MRSMAVAPGGAAPGAALLPVVLRIAAPAAVACGRPLPGPSHRAGCR
ncbi:MAG: hypothetical protein ACK56F_18255 [bacterium]